MKRRQSPLQSFFLKGEAFISAKGFHAQTLSIGFHFKKCWLEEVLRIAKKWGIWIVGPNGIGIINVECIHGHFYQPLRETPWLEGVELEDSAYPYHDWNERITAECYAPNTASRILDTEKRITEIVNNYSKMSFNFGPTPLGWIERHQTEVYHAIFEADRLSMEKFSGHGSALAQVYNHMIMPLANRRDKYTQVLWGIKDFEKRFGRFPEGMWLPETAVDTETLELLAEVGIKFTVLAPSQAKRVKRMRKGVKWYNVDGGRIDPTTAYLCYLPSRKAINLFFYDGPISQDIAFGGLLNNGEPLLKDCFLHLTTRETGLRWSTLQRMVRVMVIITVLVIWPLPIVCTSSNLKILQK